MSSRKGIYFTADWHIGHKNVIDFDNRPFRNLDHMHNVLINNFNSTVSSFDITYFLGDAGLCNTRVLKDVIGCLRGTKVLLLGNHDKGVNAMYGIGFDAVLYAAEMRIAGQRVTLSHCPLLGVKREQNEGMVGGVDGEHWHGETRHQRFSVADTGQFHLHGHIHSPNGGKSERICGRQFDVGVVANRYTPVSIGTIEKWIAKEIHSCET